MPRTASKESLAPEMNCIAGVWQRARGREAFENRNPANTDELVGHFPRSRGEDIDAAVAAAKAAYPKWSAVPAPQRGALLRSCAEVLKTRKDELARLMSREMGKPLHEAR